MSELKTELVNRTLENGTVVPRYRMCVVLRSLPNDTFIENKTTHKRSKLVTCDAVSMSGKPMSITASIPEKTLLRDDAVFEIGRAYLAEGAVSEKPNASGKHVVFFQLSHLAYSTITTVDDFDETFDGVVETKVGVTNLKVELPT